MCSSVVKVVANLHENFPRIQKVRSAKGEAVVEQQAAIRDVDATHADGELFTELLAERQIERRVRLEMVARDGWVAIREPRGVIDVGGSIRVPGQRVIAPDMQCVALVMIKQLKAVTEREIRQAPVDISKTQRQMIGIGQIHLASIANARRLQGQLPSIDPRALDRNREKDIGIVEVVVVEEVLRPGEKIVGVERPTAQGNGDAELMLFIAL